MPKDTVQDGQTFYRAGGQKVQVDLNNAVKMWPTVKARDWRSGTPDAEKLEARLEARHRSGLTIDLTDAVCAEEASAGMPRPWATPKSSNKGPSLAAAKRIAVGGNTTSRLEDQVAATSSAPSGQLNPDWAEALMGVPIGYTDPDCDEPVRVGDWPAWMGEEQKAWEPDRIAPGKKNRKERLVGIGGGVVPQIGCLLGLWIRATIEEMRKEAPL